MTMTTILPPIVPHGWAPTRLGVMKGMECRTHLAKGLYATASIEVYTSLTDNPPLDLAGVYRRIVISRRDRYPDWDEMRDFVRQSGFFDRGHDVFMLIPPDAEYVNVHQNAFHWWQRDLSLWANQQLTFVRAGLVLR